MGSYNVFLRIAFPTPSPDPIKEFSNIVGLDLGIRDLVSFAIRKKGVSTQFPDIRPDINSSQDIITGSIVTPKYQESSKRLNFKSRYTHKTMSKFIKYQKRFNGVNFNTLSFASDDPRFFYLYNLQKLTSSLQRKKGNVNNYTTHVVSTDLLRLGLYHKVKTFIFEDLQRFQDTIPVGTRDRAYRFSSTLFGQVIHKIVYKAEYLYGYTGDYLSLVNPGYTSQICPLGVIDNNVLLPIKSKDRKPLVIKDNSNHLICRTHRLNKKIPNYTPDKKGKVFIHDPKHLLPNYYFENKIVPIDRDVSASIVLSYCQSK